MHDLGLSLLFGLVVGFSLGLTGGGGSIFAVPLLMYGLGMPLKEAVGVSLAAVGTTSLLGALGRLRTGELQIAAGVVFALVGMAGTPLGVWLHGQLPEKLLLVLFAGLMLVIAIRMAWVSSGPRPAATVNLAGFPSWLRWLTLAASGFAVGVLSGMFGVGGGFLIVPALVLVGGMEMHRATATSLLVIALISLGGVISHLKAGRPLSWEITAAFVLGGAAGLALAIPLARRLSGAALRQIFAAVIVAVALFILFRTLYDTGG
ncbi:MAG: sulfite exporter TauE/SafE family protein [Gemmatales bacterium]|nr:sulfite exporter TauE/SafE family protein [Gemmatales bacterium]MDW8388355.1 sulfite exporter TauE/SafE family protein [Gemmatales bacterium]